LKSERLADKPITASEQQDLPSANKVNGRFGAKVA